MSSRNSKSRDPKLRAEGANPAEDSDLRDLTLEQRRRQHRLNGLKILVVEDTSDARTLIARQLQTAGASVFTAASAEEARDILRRCDPDAIVSDIGMPDEDGIAFVQKLRQSEINSGKHIPAIALTAFVSIEHRHITLRAGFEEHLCKPVTASALIDTILRVILTGHTSLH